MTPIQRWHQVMETRNADLLEDMLAPDCVFHSPVVHKPQEGRDLTRLYLTAAMHTLGVGGNFRYLREVIDGHHAVLEFQTEVDGIQINGVDMIEWNDAGQIVDFKVMVRPLKAINHLHAMMKAMLEQMAAGQQ